MLYISIIIKKQYVITGSSRGEAICKKNIRFKFNKVRLPASSCDACNWVFFRKDLLPHELRGQV